MSATSSADSAATAPGMRSYGASPRVTLVFVVPKGRGLRQSGRLAPVDEAFRRGLAQQIWTAPCESARHFRAGPFVRRVMPRKIAVRDACLVKFTLERLMGRAGSGSGR